MAPFRMNLGKIHGATLHMSEGGSGVAALGAMGSKRHLSWAFRARAWSRSRAPPLSSEIFLPADGHVSHEHNAGVPFEERAKAGQDRFDFFLRYHRHNHLKTLLLAEHEMGFANAVMPLSRHIADD